MTKKRSNTRARVFYWIDVILIFVLIVVVVIVVAALLGPSLENIIENYIDIPGNR